MRTLILAAALSVTSVGHAADLGEMSTVEAPGAVAAPAADWVIEVSPYLWAAGLKGSVSPFRAAPTFTVEKSFSDVLEDLNFGGFLNVWARYERFVFSADIMYVDVGEARSIGALPYVGATPGLSASAGNSMFSATALGGFRVFDDGRATVDVLGGVRWWQISTSVTAQFAGFSRHYGEDFGWVDPLVGVRAFYRLTDRFSAMVQADAGGFGLGAESTWQVIGTVNYAFTDRLSASIGYKSLGVDYASDGHVFDTRLDGPVAGVTFRF